MVARPGRAHKGESGSRARHWIHLRKELRGDHSAILRQQLGCGPRADLCFRNPKPEHPRLRAAGQFTASGVPETSLRACTRFSRAGIDKGTLSLLERSRVVKPQPAILRALAAALEMPLADLFAAAHYLQANELPSLRPYMRAKYQDLPAAAVDEVEAFVDEMARRHQDGPRNNEDEH
jgi:transcriptional regulator with XRE-family HTH domain